jgi:hypothetical protein
MLQPMCILYVWRGLTVEWRRRALEIRPAQTLRLHLLLSYVSKLAVRIALKHIEMLNTFWIFSFSCGKSLTRFVIRVWSRMTAGCSLVINAACYRLESDSYAAFEEVKWGVLNVPTDD